MGTHVHPKTWEHGVMPLDRFSPGAREQIQAAVESPTPPRRWVEVCDGMAQIESRVWYEWHWARGRKLHRIEGPTRRRAKIPASVRGAIYARDGFRCLHCGARHDLCLDHIHPWSLGGADDPSNLQTLCRSCNSKKGARV